jgi:hypothetical protein
MSVLLLDRLEAPLRDAAVRRFGSKRGVFVTAVFEGLPASAAGVKVGDRILEVEGAGPRTPTWRLAGIGVRATTGLSLPAIEGSEITLSIQRGAQSHQVRVPVRLGCGYPVSLARSDEINAFAWRDQVVLLSGILRFMRRDEALALVVGHEIGHVVLGHTRRSSGSSLRLERDADYLGAYLAARAGFTLNSDDYALLRLSYEDPTQLAQARGATHPSGPERQLAFERTLDEIRRKRETGAELVPEGL